MILIVYRTLAPFVALALPIVAIFNRKVRLGLNLRRARPTPPRFTMPPVWIHVSSGEFEYAKPVIRELKRRRPEQPVVVTYFSPSYAARVTEFPGVDHAEPLPLDLPGPVTAFLDRVDPALCLIARTDFWPELLTQTGRRGIPRVVFAYTQRPVTGLKAWFSRAQLRLVDEVRVVGEADRAATLKLAPHQRVVIDGDPRYDQVAYRLVAANHGAKPKVDDPPTLIAGSTWDEDEAVLIPALTTLLKDRRLRLILVPHEPSPAHVARATARIERAGLTVNLASGPAPWTNEHVWLVDHVGRLAELYARATFALIGGSFKARVHSVMEALGAGLITFVGPHHQNNREATDFAAVELTPDLRGVTVVQNQTDLAKAVEQALKLDHQAIATQIKAEFTHRTGASIATTNAIETHLNDKSIMLKTTNPTHPRATETPNR